MTIIYFIRHAKPDFNHHDDLTRPLTSEGVLASQAIAHYLHQEKIQAIYSSPYQRAIQTVEPLATQHHLLLQLIPDFRERRVSHDWIEDFNAFAKRQWEDFDYKLPHGESLKEVQTRNIDALQQLLLKHPHDTLVIGTHGTALSTILHYYHPTFNYSHFDQLKHWMPWILKIEFNDSILTALESFRYSPIEGLKKSAEHNSSLF